MAEEEPVRPCCAPGSQEVRLLGPVRAARSTQTGAGGPAGRHLVEQRSVSGQVFVMGDRRGDGWFADGETPCHPVRLAPYSIDATTVTNADFGRFVDATGHVTEAERSGWSAVFHLALQAPESDVVGRPDRAPWWLGVREADWRHPGGANSSTEGLEDHPVVHVSWGDAVAYCAWAGRALPTEAQWEAASRGGLAGARFPWGADLLDDEGRWRCNIWQGAFPRANSRDDGWLTTAPVRSYAPNGYGLWQTVGNVWEWCSDWFSPGAYEESDQVDPSGPVLGTHRVMRGGSYLCHDSYCNRYRNAARSSNTPDSSSGNIGFRTVAVVPDDGRRQQTS